ncbi:MAG: substrate-binding domain-containing protein [Acidobacteriota bacterium]
MRMKLLSLFRPMQGRACQILSRPGAFLLTGAFFLAAAILPGRSLAADTSRPVVFAVGTSTYDTELLDLLLPDFEAETGTLVKVVAIGSGQALAMAERGEADLVLSHAPEAEKAFMARGLGSGRWRMMTNDFVVVGPSSDPARVQHAQSAREVFQRIERSEALFISRGDESGTHMLEKRLWRLTEHPPPPAARYIETGQGQGMTLRIASEKGAYALADRATFLIQVQVIDLEVLYEGDPVLRNVYHLIISSPENGPRVNEEGARQLAHYLLSPRVLGVLEEFGRTRFGRPLFVPDAEPFNMDAH